MGINSLSEEELVDLNNRIVERLRFLHQARAHSRMLDFKIGDRVSFQPEADQYWSAYSRATTRRPLPLSPKAANVGMSHFDYCIA